MILLTAAAGNQGKILLPKLVAAGHKVRAVRTTPGRDYELRELGAVEVLVGDAADRSFLRCALKDIDTVYHVGPSAHPLEQEMGFALVDLASEFGVLHLVYSSVLHPALSRLLQHKIKRNIEERIIESGINFTILQPSDYMMPMLVRPAFSKGVFELSFDLKRRQAMIDLEDLADVSTKVLSEGAHHWGATYELTAPGAYSAYDFASSIAKATGRPIDVRRINSREFLNDFFLTDTHGKNRYKHQYAVFEAISMWYSQHDFIGNSNVLEWLLGRPPTTLDDFIAREWDRFSAENAV
jgi:uncharacterized protein YbjT (DUF2867 family)